MNTVEILGVKIHCASRDEILARTILWADQPQPRTVFYVNAHCLNISAVDPFYREILNQGDLIYPDGISIEWASRWLNGCPLEKVTGRAWIEEFCNRATENGFKIYILAGKPGVARAAQKNLEQRHPQIQIVAARDGFFSEMDEEAILQEIDQTKPDVLFVGMGTPNQEKWLAQHRQHISSPLCWAVGALFDVVAGEEDPVPAWLDRLALEWLWRLVHDPLGKWRRVVIGFPEFILRLMISRLRV